MFESQIGRVRLKELTSSEREGHMPSKDWKPWWEKTFDTPQEQEDFMRQIGGGKPRSSNTPLGSAIAGLVGGIVASNLGQKKTDYYIVQPQENLEVPQSQNLNPTLRSSLYCVECGQEVKRSWKFCSHCSKPIQSR